VTMITPNFRADPTTAWVRLDPAALSGPIPCGRDERPTHGGDDYRHRRLLSCAPASQVGEPEALPAPRRSALRSAVPAGFAGATHSDWSLWWNLNPDVVRSYLRVLGFEDQTVSYHTQKLLGGRSKGPLAKNGMRQMWTVVAHRTVPIEQADKIDRPSTLGVGLRLDEVIDAPIWASNWSDRSAGQHRH
jgi:hypothetical protein